MNLMCLKRLCIARFMEKRRDWLVQTNQPQMHMAVLDCQSLSHLLLLQQASSEARPAEMELELEHEVFEDVMSRSSREKEVTPRKPKPQPKKRIGKGELYCQGCGVSKKADLFPSAQAVCVECKRYLDRIYGQCQRQGELEWWRKQRHDGKKLKAMLDSYRGLLTKTASAGAVPKVTVAELKEVIKTEQQLALRDRGRLMWENQVTFSVAIALTCDRVCAFIFTVFLCASKLLCTSLCE